MCGFAGRHVVIGLAALLGFVLALPAPAMAGDDAPHIVSSRLLTDNGGTLDWCRAKNIIAFDREVAPGKREIFTIRPDGSNETCITCGMPDLPEGVRGQPAWHPSCEFMAVQAQGPHFKGSSYEYLSWGFHHDIWLLARDGSWAQKIVSSTLGGAVLAPQFSDDGLMLVWGERQVTGRRVAQSRDPRMQTPAAENPWDGWSLAVADVVPRPGSRVGLANRRTFFQRREGFVEPSAVAGARIWFARSLTGLPFTDQVRNVNADGREAITVDLGSGSWEAQAVPSPGHNLIALSSSYGFNWHYPPDLGDTLQTELWVVDKAGTPFQLTRYNSGLVHGERALAVDHAWGPGGRQIASYSVVAGIGKPRHEIRILTLDRDY